jgi:hypothetical protein
MVLSGTALDAQSTFQSKLLALGSQLVRDRFLPFFNMVKRCFFAIARIKSRI